MTYLPDHSRCHSRFSYRSGLKENCSSTRVPAIRHQAIRPVEVEGVVEFQNTLCCLMHSVMHERVAVLSIEVSVDEITDTEAQAVSPYGLLGVLRTRNAKWAALYRMRCYPAPIQPYEAISGQNTQPRFVAWIGFIGTVYRRDILPFPRHYFGAVAARLRH